MNLTQNQKQAVFTDKNCVVSAGAGSGKTGVLSQRFLRLVKEKKAHSNQILTLTFTKKATSEMKSRIYGLLLEEAENKTVDIQEVELFENSYISTVDSLCAEIVRKDCMQYGLCSDFTVMDTEEFLEKMQDLAYDFISSKENEDLVLETLKYVTVQSFVTMLSETATSCFNLAETIDFEKQAQNYIQIAKLAYESTQKQLDEKAAEYVSCLACDDKLKNNVKVLENFLNKQIKAKDIVFDSSRGTGSENQALAKALKEEIKSLSTNNTVYESTINNVTYIKNYYNFVHQFSTEVSRFKRSNGVLIFPDIMALSLKILVNNKEIRSYYKKAFKYIMIDEFQDNNDDYRKLIYLLAEKENVFKDNVPEVSDLESSKIFLVGDQKQSIYRFRGADVSVFRKMEDQIKLSGGEHIELETNFRSTRALVEAFNTIFSKVMDKSDRSYEACFKRVESCPANAGKSRIIFHNFIRPNRVDYSVYEHPVASSSMSEACSLASLIETMVSTDEFLLPKGRPSYSDIAILFRSGTHQGEYEKALRLKNIPYSLSETRSLTMESLTNDFFNALQLCLYPYDKISENAYNQSPLGKCDLANLKNIVKEGSIAQSVSYIWYNMGYRNFIISNPANRAFEEHYDYLFSLAVYCDSCGKDHLDFLDYLRPRLGKAEKIRDLAVLKENTEGVKLMTVHASKGLQFPIVIFAGMDTGKDSLRQEFACVKKDSYLYLPCTLNKDNNLRNIYDLVHPNEETDMENAETRRIFYVAATRAENHLVFSASPTVGKLEKDEDKLISPVKMLLDACPFNEEKQCFEQNSFMEAVKFDFVALEDTYNYVKLTQKAIDSVKPWYNCSIDNFNYSTNRTSVTSLCQNKQSNSTEKLQTIESDEIIRLYNLQTEFGTLVHTYIESFLKNTKLSVTINNSFLTAEQKNILEKDAKTLAENFMKSNLFLSVKDSEIHSEESFMVYRDNCLVEGTIDFYAVCDNTVILVDFKTDLYKDPQMHASQLGYYSDALEGMYPEKTVKSCVFYLRDASKVEYV